MDFCFYCHKPCGIHGFCDEECKEAYDREMEFWHEVLLEEANLVFEDYHYD
jgi:hypothetical protein